MPEFRFFHPIEVRYADIDAQRHVNNVAYFTYMEQARAAYLVHLGLWDGAAFDEIGIILVEASCIYKAPIAFGQRVQVGVHTAKIGTKSFEMLYSIQDADGAREMAVGRTVLVAFDYARRTSIPVPETWRKTILRYEGSA